MKEATQPGGNPLDSHGPLSSDTDNAHERGLMGQFFHAAYKSAVQKPAESLAQLAGAKVSVEQPSDTNLTGMARVADIAGSSAGQILDFVVLQKICGSAITRVAANAGEKSALAATLAENSLGWHVASSGTMGFAYGSLFTPVEEGKSQWTRLGQGLVDAGTFMTLGGVSAKLGTSLSTSLTERLTGNMLAGGAAGIVNTNLDALNHGKKASLSDTAQGAIGWAVGNVAFGEGAYWVGAGANAANKLISGRSSFEAPPAEAIGARAAGVAVAGDSAVAAPRLTRIALDMEPREAPLGAGHEQPAPLENIEKLPPSKVAPTETVSMRELAHSENPADKEKFERILDAYMPELQRAFPLKGEIETRETYVDYLKDGEGTWDMVVLRDKEHNIIGGIQYQIIDVKGDAIKNAAWGEHIWLKKENRTFENFRGLLKIAETQIRENGGDLVFMEFNNPEKMTVQQIIEDASAGLGPADREKVWGRTGIHVAVDGIGNVAEYGQPSMGEGEPPVEFLSLGFIGLTPLTGRTISKGDYLKLTHAAHATIPTVDLKTDPTVQFYTESVNAVADDRFTFVPLNALSRARTAAESARQSVMSSEVAKAVAKGKPKDEVQSALLQAIGDHAADMSPQELSQLYSALPHQVKQAIQASLEIKLK